MIEDGKKYDMTKVSEMKDIGVIVDSELKFDKHINSKIETANKILGIIRRSFIYLDADIFLPLYKALVRSHFDYAMIMEQCSIKSAEWKNMQPEFVGVQTIICTVFERLETALTSATPSC